MTQITQAREAYKSLESEYQAKLATLQQTVDEAVIDAYLTGDSISQICREYGTSARATIITILRIAGVYQGGKFPGTAGSR